MFYGLIDGNGVLVQKQRNPQSGFVQIPDNAVCGMIYDQPNDTWSLPDPDIEVLRQKALDQINKNHTNCVADCRGYYDNTAERETWDHQKKEAEEYTANPLAVTPFMDAFISANSNMTKAQLATTIMANAAAMAAAAGDLGGQLSAKRAAILAATNETELDAVDLTFTKPTISLTDK